MPAQIPNLLIGFGVLAVVFGVIEWRWPSIRGQRRLRKGVFTDLAYFLFTPTVGKLFTGVVVFVSVLSLAALFGVGLTGDHLRGLSERDTAVGRQPVWLQLVEFLLLADLLGYWQHRAFHGIGRLWRIHAVHHSSTEVDWLSSVRVHPLNDAIASTVVAAPLLLLGFSQLTVAAYLPFITLYAIAIHANLSWDLGPLRYVITTPAFHRWHHSAEAEALNKNFAGLLPVFDMVFGTYYFPKEKRATLFGVVGEAVPAGFVGQLLHPFRSPERVRAERATV